MIQGAVFIPLDENFPPVPLPVIHKDSVITLGRVEQDVALDAGATLVYVSRKHATLSMDGGALLMNDTSANGTLLNGRLFKRQSFALHDGDTLVCITQEVFIACLPWNVAMRGAEMPPPLFPF
jgi:pSer/pThr/pTyr-binding forkhead associated (FHA) protein